MTISDKSGENIVTLDNVSKDYHDDQIVHAVRNVSLEIACAEMVGIIGPSGSGKSTLLHLICGLDEPSSGTIKFLGAELSKMSDNERTRLRREKIGMVFQNFNLMPTLTAMENVALPLRLQGMNRSDAKQQAEAVLERVGLRNRNRYHVEKLSGGERQRVAIARALIFHAPLLLADEPTGNLDSATGESILRLLVDLQRQDGTTVVLVTHNALAEVYCGRILTLRDGSVVGERRNRPDAYT